MGGFNVQNINSFARRFICTVCSLLLCDPVRFTTCRHRQCRSCFDPKAKNVIKCAQCQTETPRSQILVDRDFKNDMECLPILCSLCDWAGILKDYEEHNEQVHSNPKCNYCDEQFYSFHSLNQHKASQCEKITVECSLKDFGCHQQILRRELSNHYQTVQHQDSILRVIQQMKSQLTDTQMDVDTSQITTTADNDVARNRLEFPGEIIRVLSSDKDALSEGTQRLDGELTEHQLNLQCLTENASNVKLAIEEQSVILEEMTQNLNILHRELTLLKETIDGTQYVSHDGTYTWKITNFQEKMIDAQSGRQLFINSLPFYSSSSGYKMRVRLYLNGNGSARRTHMSLFVVLMRGKNDSLLTFPFNFKVTFCLYDQITHQRHIIDSFQPDIRSSSVQRPQSDMNIASGIPKFFSLEMIQQEGNPYVRDDTMFIKVTIDFVDMSNTLVPFALYLNPGLPSNIQQRMIENEVQRRAAELRTEQGMLNDQIYVTANGNFINK